MNITEKRTEELIPYINNPRKNDNAVDAVASSIAEFGFKVPIVIDKNNIIVAGHTRLKAAKKLGLESVPVIIADDLTDTQIKAFRLADNKVSEQAEWDEDLLKIELQGLEELNFDMEDFGFDLTEPENIEDIIEDEPPEPPVEPQAKIGDIYQLGEHRLMCGDSTDPEAVSRLMNGEKADLVLTDPPYGVSYNDKNEYLNSIGKGNCVQRKIEHDHDTPTDISNLWIEALKNAKEFSKEKMSFYISSPQGGELLLLLLAIQEAGFMIKHTLIWVKNNHVLGRADYNYKHEPIIYGWKPEGTHNFYGAFDISVFEDKLDIDKLKKDEMKAMLKELLSDKVPTDVIHEAKPLISNLHPTMKPIKLLARLIKNSSQRNDIVLDLFGGSGSTLMAAEQLSRRCYTMEIDPKYIDVIIERWENFTGKKAVKL